LELSLIAFLSLSNFSALVPIERIEAIWPRGRVNRPAHKFKLFLQSDYQGSELPRLFSEPPNGATSENNHKTSEIC
jgi:hypothetical protein